MEINGFYLEDEIIEKILSPYVKSIMIIGGSDTGKTTLIEALSSFLSRKYRTGIVDADIGQSHIGLPTTIGWGYGKAEFPGWEAIRVEDFYFTGTLSPPGNLLQVLTGTKLITEKAMAKCEKIIIDTTGLISGPGGRVLKQYKIDLVKPDLVLAIEKVKELTWIIKPFESQARPLIYRVRTPEAVGSKSIHMRIEFRHERFRRYFHDIDSINFNYHEIPVRFTRDIIRFNYSEMKDRLLSFRDKENKDFAIGVVDGIDIPNGKLHVIIPGAFKETILTRTSTVLIGPVRINLHKILP